MYKIKNLSVAIRKAKEEKLKIGLCVNDGFFYIGSEEELKKIPVIRKEIK